MKMENIVTTLVLISVLADNAARSILKEQEAAKGKECENEKN